MADVFDSLVWQGNSKKMYQAILNAVPPMFIESVKQSIMNWITKKKIQVITEEIVFKAVNEIAPPIIANMISPALEKLRTK